MENTLIKVSRLTHMKVKEQAKQRGMTIMGYVNWLADQDKKKLMKGK